MSSFSFQFERNIVDQYYAIDSRIIVQLRAVTIYAACDALPCPETALSNTSMFQSKLISTMNVTHFMSGPPESESRLFLDLHIQWCATFYATARLAFKINLVGSVEVYCSLDKHHHVLHFATRKQLNVFSGGMLLVSDYPPSPYSSS